MLAVVGYCARRYVFMWIYIWYTRLRSRLHPLIVLEEFSDYYCCTDYGIGVWRRMVG